MCPAPAGRRRMSHGSRSELTDNCDFSCDRRAGDPHSAHITPPGLSVHKPLNRPPVGKSGHALIQVRFVLD